MKGAIFLLAIFFLACYVVWHVSNPVGYPERTGARRTVRIDECQYIEEGFKDSRGHVLTHKGNCDNPIHRR